MCLGSTFVRTHRTPHTVQPVLHLRVKRPKDITINCCKLAVAIASNVLRQPSQHRYIQRHSERRTTSTNTHNDRRSWLNIKSRQRRSANHSARYQKSIAGAFGHNKPKQTEAGIRWFGLFAKSKRNFFHIS